jgi:hypothetical protein
MQEGQAVVRSQNTVARMKAFLLTSDYWLLSTAFLRLS